MIGWISLLFWGGVAKDPTSLATMDDLISAEDCGYGTSNAAVIGKNRRSTAAADDRKEEVVIIEPRTFMMVVLL